MGLMYFWGYGVLFNLMAIAMFFMVSKRVPEIMDELLRFAPYMDHNENAWARIMLYAVIPVFNYIAGILVTWIPLSIKLKYMGKIERSVVDILIEAKERQKHDD